MGGGNLSPRIAGLDILRALAIVIVIGGHWFINTDFNSTPFNSPLLFFLGMVQSFTMIGVPLFLMLTGYLNYNKTEISRKYLRGMRRVLVAYLFFSIVTILFRKYYLGHEKSTIQWVLSIFSFEAIPYSWYIEMWIGLYLLTPFLNKLWSAIESKKQRIALIVILFVCTSLPDFTNRYGMHLLPGYWTAAAYPLLCFYLGAYLRDYQPNYKAIYLVGIITALSMLNPVASMLLASDRPMLHIQGGSCGIVSIPITVCTFLLFYKSDIVNSSLRSLVTKISLLSLDMYLVAYLFDQWIYPLWYSALGSTQAEIAPFYLLIILSLVIGTFLTACAKDFIFNRIKILFKQKNKSL